ncbi:MAG: hypothetical protein JSU98_01555 [Gemmatimonadales bacterium]|jgi:hypothetical protein|nr:MAG: hypothetical protein JSU98_01555 [Gemmatimonadales bacterium]
MRWLLQWLLDDLRRFFNPQVGPSHALREGMVRARQRQSYHEEEAREASERAGQLLQRVRALEMSPEADVTELVAARKDLVVAEGDLRHHRARAEEAREALRLMRADRDNLAQGGEAEHRDRYAHLLNR